MRRALVLITLILIPFLISPTAAIAAFDPSPEDVCSPIGPATSRLDPRKLVKYLLREVGLDDLDLDTSARDLTYADRVEAILDPNAFCARSSCREGTEQKLRTALAYLNNYFMRHTLPLRSGSSGIQIIATSGAELPEAQFLRDPNSIATICILPIKSKQQMAEAPMTKAVRGALDHVRVRANASDLVYGRDESQFEGLDRATISATRDNVADSQSYAINGVVGYAFNKAGIFETLIPFYSYKREGTHTKNQPKDSVTEIEGAGLSAEMLFPFFGYYQILQAYPLYTHDTQADTELFAGNINWFPDFPFPGVGRAYFILNGAASFVLNPQVNFIYSTVLNDNGDPAFRETNESSRLGARIELTVFPESELLRGFSLFAAYQYFQIFEGPLSEADRFEIALNYSFPKQEYWALQLKYVDGRNMTTLEEENELTLGAGLKY